MLLKDISYLTISDIHLGHVRNHTENIINNLDSYFYQYDVNSPLAKLDIVFIAGDLFDGLLNYSSSNIAIITEWLARVMVWCSRTNTKLRILEGTPSHDWKQSRNAISVSGILGMLNVRLDFLYVDTLHIEYMEDLNLHILYVPDEWTSDTATTFVQVRQLMSDLNIEYVDIAQMHGLFPHQLKFTDGIQKHSPEDYLGIVIYYINIGHIHNFSVYYRILGQGSFDRLSHGEEEPKGGIICHINCDGSSSWEFVENIHARIFKTIEVTIRDLDKAVAKLDKDIYKLPTDSYVRLKIPTTHRLFTTLDELKLRYPLYYLTKVKLDEDSAIVSPKQTTEWCKSITITPDNVTDIITEGVLRKTQLTETQLTTLRGILCKTLK